MPVLKEWHLCLSVFCRGY